MESKVLDRVPATTVERIIGKFKRDETPYAIAAAFVGEITLNDLDGVRWRFVVSDGARIDTIDAGVSGSNGGRHRMQVNPAALERVVEKRAGQYARESRFADLVAASPLVLERLED